MAEYKQGDVVIGVYDAVQVKGNLYRNYQGILYIHPFDEGARALPVSCLTDIRPLIVIDKTDPALRERAMRILPEHATEEYLDAILDALTEPEPLAEPGLEARPLDRFGEEWVLTSAGDWTCVSATWASHSWDVLTAERGPMRLGGGER